MTNRAVSTRRERDSLLLTEKWPIGRLQAFFVLVGLLCPGHVWWRNRWPAVGFRPKAIANSNSEGLARWVLQDSGSRGRTSAPRWLRRCVRIRFAQVGRVWVMQQLDCRDVSTKSGRALGLQNSSCLPSRRRMAATSSSVGVFGQLASHFSSSFLQDPPSSKLGSASMCPRKGTVGLDGPPPESAVGQFRHKGQAGP